MVKVRIASLVWFAAGVAAGMAYLYAGLPMV